MMNTSRKQHEAAKGTGMKVKPPCWLRITWYFENPDEEELFANIPVSAPEILYDTAASIGRPPSLILDQMIVDYFKAHLTYAEIAHRCHMGHQAVRNRIQALIQEKRITKKECCQRDRAVHSRKGRGRKRDKRIMELCRKNYTNAEIAKKIGLARTTVLKYTNRFAEQGLIGKDEMQRRRMAIGQRKRMHHKTIPQNIRKPELYRQGIAGYQEGLTYLEIQHRTRASLGSISRWVAYYCSQKRKEEVA